MSVEISGRMSVTDMARMVGLSRARFYQLMGTAFPWPIYDVATRRPFYDIELQKICLEVRRCRCGIDGKPILFYARPTRLATATTKRPKLIAKNLSLPPHLERTIKDLGLQATSTEVVAAVEAVFPRGIRGVEPNELARSVFLHLMKNGA
jgi:hypothetical protein